MKDDADVREHRYHGDVYPVCSNVLVGDSCQNNIQVSHQNVVQSITPPPPAHILPLLSPGFISSPG